MNQSFIITWNDTEVGELVNVSGDMWYLDAKWHPNESAVSKEFEKKLAVTDPKSVIADPANAMKVVLYKAGEEAEKVYCLALSLDGDQISLRQVVSDQALDLLFPHR